MKNRGFTLFELIFIVTIIALMFGLVSVLVKHGKSGHYEITHRHLDGSKTVYRAPYRPHTDGSLIKFKTSGGQDILLSGDTTIVWVEKK